MTATVVAVAIAAACAVRLVATLQQGLSTDEWLTAAAISLDVPALIRDRLAGGHSPFYFLLLKFIGLDSASPDMAIRLPSVIFDSLAAGILVWTAARISGLYGALAMLIFAVFTPALISHGQIARPYALLHFFLALTLAGATMAVRLPRITGAAFGVAARRGRAFRTLRLAVAAVIVGLIGAGYTHNIGLIAAVLIPAALCLMTLRYARALRLWMLAMSVIWLALLPGLLALAPTLRKFADYYWVETVSPFTLESIWRILVAVYGLTILGPAQDLIGAPLRTLFALLIAAFALLAVLFTRRRAATRLTAIVAAGLPLSLLAISAVQSLLLTRYFVSSLLAYLLLAANGAAVAARTIVGRLVLLAVLAAVAIQGVNAMLTPRNLDWRVATAFLDLTSFGIVRGIADTPVEKGLVERYAPAGLDIDLALEPDAAKGAALLSTQLEGEPFVWALLGWRRGASLDLSPYVTCTWRFGQSRIVAVAKARENLPAILRGCRAENGSLATTFRRLRAAG